MEEIFTFLREQPGTWSLVVVFCAAMLEYVVPPLPADSVLLASSLLIVAGVYPFFVVYLVAVAGGLVGAAVHFGLGQAIRRRPRPVVSRLVDRFLGRDAFERFVAAFRKYGMWVMAFNRAMPGVRGVSFIAAGSAGLPFVRTMLFGLISNLGWTLLILFAGVSVGGQWEKIQAAGGVLSVVGYVLLGLALVGYLGYRGLRWRRRRLQARSVALQGRGPEMAEALSRETEEADPGEALASGDVLVTDADVPRGKGE